MKITKITIGRLFNLGSYEHIRYELTCEVAEPKSPREALLGLENIIVALNPKPPANVKSDNEIAREKSRVERMRELDDEAFRHYRDAKDDWDNDY